MRPEALVLDLARAAIEGGVLMGLAWVVGRAWPGLPAAARALAWWWVCARLLVSLLPLAPFHVAVFPTPRGPDGPILSTLSLSGTVPAMPATRAVLTETSTTDAGADVSGTAPEVESTVAVRHVLPGGVGMPVVDELPRDRAEVATRQGRPLDRDAWMTLGAWALLALWGAGAVSRLLALLFQSLHVRRLARDARPVGWSRVEGGRGGFEVAISDRIRVPLALGLLRPRILIPSRMLECTADELSSALAHEGAHLRRGDLWMAWIPAVAEALFWFHPLVRVAAREYLQACEEACDEDALRATGISPYRYGRLLLAFGVERPLAGAAAIPLGSPHADQLHRRLTMLQRVVSVSRRARVAAAAVVGLLAALAMTPVHVVPTAATPRTAAPPAMAPAPEPSPAALELGVAEAPEAPAPAATPRPARAPRAQAAVQSGCTATAASECTAAARECAGAAASECPEAARKAVVAGHAMAAPAVVTPPTPVAPFTPVVPLTPLAPFAAVAAPTPPTPPTPVAPLDGRKASTLAYVLATGDGESSGSGEREDWREVNRLRDSVEGDFFWVRINGKRYLIQDPGVLERIKDIFEPQRELGEQQSRLGDRQSTLGDRQSELGDRQAELGDRQSELADQQMELAEEEANATSLERKRELERIHRELSEAQEELARHQEDVGQKQEQLGRRQEELGRHQEALALEMARHTAQIRSGLRALVEEAARQGKARRLE